MAASSSVSKSLSGRKFSSEMLAHTSLSPSWSQVNLGHPTLFFHPVSAKSVFSGVRIVSRHRFAGGARSKWASSSRLRFKQYVPKLVCFGVSGPTCLFSVLAKWGGLSCVQVLSIYVAICRRILRSPPFCKIKSIQ